MTRLLCSSCVASLRGDINVFCGELRPEVRRASLTRLYLHQLTCQTCKSSGLVIHVHARGDWLAAKYLRRPASALARDSGPLSPFQNCIIMVVKKVCFVRASLVCAREAGTVSNTTTQTARGHHRDPGLLSPGNQFLQHAHVFGLSSSATHTCTMC